MAEYPCKNCTRVENPEQCTNRNCPEWKEWFMERWAEINNFGRRYVKEGKKEDG